MKFRISIWTKFSLWRSHISGADHSSRNCPEWSIITCDMYFYLMYFLAQVKDICWGADKTDKVTGPLWIQSFVNLMEGTGGRAGCIWIWRSGWLCVVIILTIAICSWLPMWGYTHTHTEVRSRFRVTAVMWFVVGKSECEIMYLKLWNTFVNLWKEKIHWICQSTPVIRLTLGVLYCDNFDPCDGNSISTLKLKTLYMKFREETILFLSPT